MPGFLPNDLPEAVYHAQPDIRVSQLLRGDIPKALLGRFAERDRTIKEWVERIRTTLRLNLNPLQAYWLRVYASRESFSLTAPPGLGKSTFLLTLPLLDTERRFLFILPTRSLVSQQAERAAYAHASSLTSTLDEIRTARVAFITTAYYHRHARELGRWDVISIDDADSLIRKPQHAEKIIRSLTRGGQVLIATATLPRTLTHAFLKLGFQPAGLSQPVREVDEYALHADPSIDRIDQLIPLLQAIHEAGGGSFILLSPAVGRKDDLHQLQELLAQHGVTSILSDDFHKARDQFAHDYPVALGIAHPYNPLVRGIDLPERLYAIFFIGIPGRIISWDAKSLVRIAQAGLLKTRLARSVMRALQHEDLSEEEWEALIREAARLIKAQPPRGILVTDEGVLIPDIRTYLQASGRTSRLTLKGITHGLSIILDTQEAVSALGEKSHQYGQPIHPQAFSMHAFNKSLQRVRESREHGKPVRLDTRFILVESPAKAKRIASFTGRPGIRVKPGLILYESMHGTRLVSIAATIGHLTDLDMHCADGVCKEDGTYVPHYHSEVSEGKNREDTIRSMSEVAWQHQQLLMLSDPDREGEKIAMDGMLLTTPWLRQAARGELHAITRSAYEHLETRLLDARRVKAQMTRRILDRWVGFQLSRYLQEKLGRKTLSAGRVQTPVLGWILEREEERKEKACRITLEWEGMRTSTLLPKAACPNASLGSEESRLVITLRETREAFLPPPRPYTTSILLEDAARYYHLTSEETMRILQDLYEQGFITYPRTDTAHLSPEALRLACSILTEEGLSCMRNPHEPPGAHEAIRPTGPIHPDDLLTAARLRGVGLSEAHQRVYRLVYHRFLASQLPAARLQMGKLTFTLPAYELSWEEEQPVDILEEGFTRFQPIRRVTPCDCTARVHFTLTSKARPYTDAELVKRMREEGIGRPSTYAHIISTLVKRGYVKRQGVFLIPTRLGKTTYQLVQEHPQHASVSVTATRELESLLDKIEEGRADWQKVLDKAYHVWYEA